MRQRAPASGPGRWEYSDPMTPMTPEISSSYLTVSGETMTGSVLDTERERGGGSVCACVCVYTCAPTLYIDSIPEGRGDVLTGTLLYHLINVDFFTKRGVS